MFKTKIMPSYESVQKMRRRGIIMIIVLMIVIALSTVFADEITDTIENPLGRTAASMLSDITNGTDMEKDLTRIVIYDSDGTTGSASSYSGNTKDWTAKIAGKTMNGNFSRVVDGAAGTIQNIALILCIATFAISFMQSYLEGSGQYEEIIIKKFTSFGISVVCIFLIGRISLFIINIGTMIGDAISDLTGAGINWSGRPLQGLLNLVYQLSLFVGVVILAYGLILLARAVSAPDESDPHTMQKGIWFAVGGVLLICFHSVIVVILGGDSTAIVMPGKVTGDAKVDNKELKDAYQAIHKSVDQGKGIKNWIKGMANAIAFLFAFFIPWIASKIAFLLIGISCIARGIEAIATVVLSPLACIDVSGRDSSERLMRYARNVMSLALQGAIITTVLYLGRVLQQQFLAEVTIDTSASPGDWASSLTLTVCTCLAMATLVGRSRDIARNIVG